MPRAVSIHIGVNQPRKRSPGNPIRHSEAAAWQMAGIAERAGYDSLLVLRGKEATCQAVHDALTRASRALVNGDSLFVSFSGHGTQLPDLEIGPDAYRDERDGWDEAWCLSDGEMVDDRLAGYWRLFASGVRIVVVSECCFAGGIMRAGDEGLPPHGHADPWNRPAEPARVVYRGAERREESAGSGAAACIEEPPGATHGIRASLLLLAACGEHQHAHDGVFTRHLLGVWNNGGFEGSYCELYRQVRERVVGEACAPPWIRMCGAADPGFPLAPAFRVDRGRHGYRSPGSSASRGASAAAQGEVSRAMRG